MSGRLHIFYLVKIFMTVNFCNSVFRAGLQLLAGIINSISLTLLNYHILIFIVELSYVYSLPFQASLFIL